MQWFTSLAAVYGRCCRTKKNRSRNSVDRRGAAAVTALLLLAGSMAVVSYVVVSSRMTADAAQLKHATDAAAMATSRAYARDSSTDVQEMAERYVQANLGFDNEQLNNQLVVSVEPYTYDDYDGFRVSAKFTAEASILGGDDQEVTVSSAAVAVYNPVELAVVLPNTSSSTSGELTALKQIVMYLAEEFIEDKEDRWMSLVPFSETVNIWDDDHPNRMREWAATDALKPDGLYMLFRKNNYGIASLASRKMPNNQTERIGAYRGLFVEECYNWTEAPQGSFYYRYTGTSAPTVNYPGQPYITYYGPPVTSCSKFGNNDLRIIVADPGIPTAPVLPLTNDLDEIEARLDMMEPGDFENHIIGLGWGAKTLAPAFRGSTGWGDEDHPLDFSSDTESNIKAIIMLAKPANDHCDSDYYNFYPCNNPYGAMELDEVSQERTQYLCTDLKDHDIKFYFIGVGEKSAGSRTIFEKYILPELQDKCASSPGDATFLDSSSFAAGLGDIEERLDEIIGELEAASSYARLVE